MADKSGYETVWEFRLAEVAANLEKNGFGVSVFSRLAEAAAYFENELMEELAPASASVGGSVTVVKAGVYDFLKKRPGLRFVDPYDSSFSLAESIEQRRQGLLVDLFVASSNALLRDGRLLNLDGTGNRVAAMHFGPRKVVLFIGRNKIVEDMDAAWARIREFAAPANNIRLSKPNPCTKSGCCMDCNSVERICNVWTLTEKCFPKRRTHILLVNEDAGY